MAYSFRGLSPSWWSKAVHTIEHRLPCPLCSVRPSVVGDTTHFPGASSFLRYFTLEMSSQTHLEVHLTGLLGDSEPTKVTRYLLGARENALNIAGGGGGRGRKTCSTNDSSQETAKTNKQTNRKPAPSPQLLYASSPPPAPHWLSEQEVCCATSFCHLHTVVVLAVAVPNSYTRASKDMFPLRL